MAPQVLEHPGARPTERLGGKTVDEQQSSAPAHPSTVEKLPKPDDTIEAHYASLERLEERYRHELLSDEERQELRNRVLKLRRRLGC
jgi:hypothetical protein